MDGFGGATPKTLVPLTDLVKVSDEDLELIAPGEPRDRPQMARRRRRPRRRYREAANGATAYDPGLPVDFPGASVEGEDTVGAGDTFQAALLSRHLGVSDLPRWRP
jgi:fructokinase